MFFVWIHLQGLLPRAAEKILCELFSDSSDEATSITSISSIMLSGRELIKYTVGAREATTVVNETKHPQRKCLHLLLVRHAGISFQWGRYDITRLDHDEVRKCIEYQILYCVLCHYLASLWSCWFTGQERSQCMYSGVLNATYCLFEFPALYRTFLWGL